jgi:hypothetical protein
MRELTQRFGRTIRANCSLSPYSHGERAKNHGLHPDRDQKPRFAIFNLPLHLGCLNMDWSLSLAVNLIAVWNSVILPGDCLHVRITAHAE